MWNKLKFHLVNEADNPEVDLLVEEMVNPMENIKRVENISGRERQKSITNSEI